MATITFTAIHDGETYTRTSGTMPYVAITVGSQVQWHKSFAAAHKAAVSRTQTWSTGKPAEVIPAYPTAVNGKVTAEDVAEIAEHGWGDIEKERLLAVYQAKLSGSPSQAALDARVETAPVPSQDEIEDTIQAEMDEQAAKRAKAAADRRRQRAAKKARENGQTVALVDPTPEFVEKVTEAPAVYPGEAEFDQLRAAKEARQRAPRVEAPAKPKGVKAITADGKKVWRGSGPAYNAYRRMREVRLQAKAAREAGDIAKAEALEVKVEERRVAWEQAKADEKASA
ncbi:hypothetical protein I5G62_gp96 [Mycobacterium phage CRB2]|uniref:Uncharacterized protein n=1 Tax=Mycobacterium phage CRB2 TaxID=2483623 RepID=A0A493QWP2_9CAUD|nr:hypothetical protein I5G62_gp96 [Mycobacterium phage CRB2]AYP70082.1 hypothetical protein CRB2_96 [Mycobacterium phage CRB2]